MQIEKKDIKIYINLKEHLWIPYLLQRKIYFERVYKFNRGKSLFIKLFNDIK